MANLMATLLADIQATFGTHAALTYIKKAYVIQSLAPEYIPEVSFAAPIALIYPLTSTFDPAYVQDVKNNATYQIGVTVLQEWWGANVGVLGNATHKGSAQIEADLQTAFDRNLFLNIVSGAMMTNASYSPLGFLQGLSQVSIGLTYVDYV